MITIVTLYDDDAVEYYVGAVQGSVGHEQRHEVASRLKAEYDVEEEEEGGRYVYFREVEIAKSAADLRELVNCSPVLYAEDGRNDPQ
jgi:peptide subunit release factor RF-3